MPQGDMCVWPWTQTEWIILLAVSEHLHVDSLFSFVFNQQKRLPFRPYMWKAKLKSPFSCGFSDKVVSDGSSFILPKTGWRWIKFIQSRNSLQAASAHQNQNSECQFRFPYPHMYTPVWISSHSL